MNGMKAPRRSLLALQITAALIVLAFLGLLGISLFTQNRGQRHSGPAPDFTLQLFNGGAMTLSQQRGKVVVINVWASWCQPCKEEARTLEEVWQRYKGRGDVLFIGVNWSDTEKQARAYIKAYGITYPNGPDLGRRIGAAYHVRGVPETYFIDKNGNVAEVYISVLNANTLTRKIDNLLAK